MSPRIFNYLQRGVHLDLGRDVFPHLVKSERFYAYPSAEYLKDMGSPDRLAAVEADVLSGKVKLHHRRNSRPAVFLDRDGVLCHHVDFLRDLGGLVLFDDVPAALSKLNRSDFLAIVITNQPVVARGWADEAQVREIHKKMETQLGRSGARFDAIYFCPHHPDKGFPGEDMTYKITCECRKPSDGMIQEAKRFFNIDLSRSYVVGDTWRDIGVGRTAGLKKCLGVKNAVGRVGEFRDQIPDKIFLNLAEAVDFILEDSKLDVHSNSVSATAIQHEGHKGGH
ncbi:MAG: HAD-IIIA family hydrolase [Bdellovibrionales bacterium]|nr:HAD-IIIA family hydrolase [Bdellovibrionales bacterium]